MKTWILVGIAVIVLMAAGYYVYYQNSVHDYRSCIEKGGTAGQNNELFYCQIDERRYWNGAPAGMVN